MLDLFNGLSMVLMCLFRFASIESLFPALSKVLDEGIHYSVTGIDCLGSGLTPWSCRHQHPD